MPYSLVGASALVAAITMIGGQTTRAGSGPPAPTAGPGKVQVDVKLRVGEELDHAEALLPADLRRSVARIEPLVRLEGKRLDALGASTMRRWFRITLRPGVDAKAFEAALERLEAVETVEPVPRPVPPP
jgi:hypothetical protein